MNLHFLRKLGRFAGLSEIDFVHINHGKYQLLSHTHTHVTRKVLPT